MPIAKEILSIFEFNLKKKQRPFHFDECPLSQQRSVPTEQLTLLVHRNLVIESHRRASVALWVHPFSLLPPVALSFNDF